MFTPPNSVLPDKTNTLSQSEQALALTTTSFLGEYWIIKSYVPVARIRFEHFAERVRQEKGIYQVTGGKQVQRH
jgi:hypothetical protein